MLLHPSLGSACIGRVGSQGETGRRCRSGQANRVEKLPGVGISLGEERSSKKKHHVQQSLAACSLPLLRQWQQQEARRAHGWMSN